MWEDEVVEEVREIRREHAAAHDFDLRKIYADVKQREATSGHPVVNLPPRKPRSRRRVAGES